MRRLRQTRIRSFTVRPRSIVKDNEGVVTEAFGEGYMVKGEIWPATSKRQIEQYGDRINNIANMRLEGEYQILTENGRPYISFNNGEVLKLGDGVLVYSSEDPDYKVLSFTEYYPLKMEVERIAH